MHAKKNNIGCKTDLYAHKQNAGTKTEVCCCKILCLDA